MPYAMEQVFYLSVAKILCIFELIMRSKKNMDLNDAPGKGLTKFALIRLLQNFPE